jgi:hypothetical protein
MFNTRQEAQRQLGSEVRCKEVDDSNLEKKQSSNRIKVLRV